MTGHLRSTLRTFKLIGLFLGASWELIFHRPATRQQRAEWLHQFCARAVRRMDVPVTVHGHFPARGALIANHRTYLDIVVLASIHPCVFVSKIEVSKLPVIGWMTDNAGTVYVERGRGGSALRAGAAMQVAVAEGLRVVFFPEGTTNAAPSLLKFHSGLLGQALVEEIPITAAYLRYSLDGDSLDAPSSSAATAQAILERDVHWGDASMFVHVFRFLALRGVRAEVRFAPQPIPFPADALHRKAAAAQARAAVTALAPPAPETRQLIPIQVHHF
jgi:lyso-ornithine lipid O-acyltransferase